MEREDNKSETVPSDDAKTPGFRLQFSLGTLLLITLMYAVLFGILTSLSVPIEVFLSVTGFTTWVGACQLLLFGGKNPRLASILAGLIPTTILAVVWVILAAMSRYGPQGFEYIFVLIYAAFWMGISALVGYWTGAAISGFFIVAGWVENILAKKRTVADSVGRDSPFDDDKVEE